MATFIEGGIDTFNALVYSDPHPNTQAFIEHQLYQPSAALTETGAAFMQKAHDLYEQFNGSEAMRLARAAVRQVKGHWDKDIIRPLTDIGMVQSAKLTMQRWLMAEPYTRAKYHKQQCEGFAGSYVDVNPGFIGPEHYDYRRVMHGIVEDTEDGWVAHEYFDDLRDGDRELHAEEQFDILRSWQTLYNAMQMENEDPTSKFNSLL